MPESEFVYLLNAMELAGQADEPAKEDFGAKRNAVIAHVDTLTARLTGLAGAAREAITASRRALPQSSTTRPEVAAAWTALDALAAALGAERA